VGSERAIRVGIVGCGYWGPNFVRNFLNTPGCVVAAASDLRPERLESLRRLHPQIRLTERAEEILRDPSIDAVAIVTPVATHFELARLALEAGKHVLVTKPMTRTLAESGNLVALAQRRERVLLVDHTFIYSGPVRKIRELIDRGDLGDVYYFDSIRVNLGLFQPDVNVLWDLACHDISILLHLVDKEPVSVAGIGARPIPDARGTLESLAYLVVRFRDETIGHIHVSWLSPVKIRRTILGGSRSMVVYDHLDPDNQVKVYDKGVEIRTAEAANEARVQYRVGGMVAPKVDQGEALGAECRHFVECIRTGAAPLTDGRSGLAVMRLLEAAQRSMEERGREVPVDLADLRGGRR
jgi:predicted dehydrogenase